MAPLILLWKLLVRDKAEKFPQFVLGSCWFLLYFLLNVAEPFLLRWGKECVWEKGQSQEDHLELGNLFSISKAERLYWLNVSNLLFLGLLLQLENEPTPVQRDYINLCGVLRHGTLSTWINGWQPRLGNLLIAFFQLRFLVCFVTFCMERQQHMCFNH